MYTPVTEVDVKLAPVKGKTSICKKLVSAMNAIDAVTKKGRNENQKYNYVKAADVAHEVRSVLVEYGIAFTFSVYDESHWEKPTNSGGIMTYCSIKATVTFADQDTGEAVSATVVGWGADTGDKAPYKAMTGALKYALRCNFLIPDESDPENEPTRTNVARTALGNAHTQSSSSATAFLRPVNTVAQVQAQVGTATITDDDLPSAIFGNDGPATGPSAFTPLTQERNTEIQNRLQELVKAKTMDRRKLSLFLDKTHGGKKAFDVSAITWEDTMSRIETAVTTGEDAVKSLLKGEV